MAAPVSRTAHQSPEFTAAIATHLRGPCLPLSEFQRLVECLNREDYQQAHEILGDNELKEHFLLKFYDFHVKKLLENVFDSAHATDSSAQTGPIQKLVRIGEFLAENGIESSYARLSRAACYRLAGESAKLEALIPEICRARGPREPSDLFQLNHLLLGWDDRDFKQYFFFPLQAAIQEHLLSGAMSFPIRNVEKRV
ncbi:MAG: hypothetical protein JSS60_09415 [Verrucomicrobia bacterium]|nr:hypothetical protein [Verrucomicrobiota bacterium]